MAANQKTNRILIVDDEPDVCVILKMVVEENGFEANYIDDPVLALESFEPGLYELLLLDIKMPEIDGFRLYKEIKKLDNKVKVCFLTASDSYYEKIRKEEFPTLDKDLVLLKPIENEDLIRHINRIISQTG
ncbi:MAG: response regulator [Candidatus Nitrosopolaris wilkensis]|nr:MAG: response regulator [Candidatus Nitrosopolaris wilkensis]